MKSRIQPIWDGSTKTDNHLVKILYTPLQNSVVERTDNILFLENITQWTTNITLSFLLHKILEEEQ